MSTQVRRFEWGSKRIAFLGMALFLVGVFAGGYRVVKNYHPPGPFSHATAGFCDFHNGLYFPARALIDGVSPYSQRVVEEYQASRPLPFFSPVILLLHMPFAVMPLRAAEICYFALLCGLVIGMGVLVSSLAGRPRRLDWIFAIAAAMIFCRGTHATFFDGYFTIELTLGTILAIHWGKSRPWLAALALVVVSAKPTYILPLGFLLLARGDYKALTLGGILSAIAAFAPFAWVASHSSEPFGTALVNVVTEIGASQEFHISVQDEMPVNTWTRIDAFAVVAKWLNINPSQTIHALVMLPLLVGPMIVLFRRQRKGIDDGVVGITGLVILTATLATVYHNSYDAQVLILPFVLILIAECSKSPLFRSRFTTNETDTSLAGNDAGSLNPISIWQRYSHPVRWAFIFLLGVQLYNYLSSRMFLSRIPDDPFLFKVVTSFSGSTLAVATVLACILAWRETTAGSANAATLGAVEETLA